MIRKYQSFILGVMCYLILFGVTNSPVQADPEPIPTSVPEVQKAPLQPEDMPGEPGKEEETFEDLIKDFEAIEGFFTFYYKEDENKVWMEIKPEQFETIFLCSITREAADGYFFDSSAMLGEFPFLLKRVGKKVLLLHKNVLFRADKDTAIQRALTRGVSDSIVGTSMITGRPHPERGSVLVDPTGFFMQDIGMVSDIFKQFFTEGGYQFDQENSYFGSIKAFPDNTEIEVILHFRGVNPYPIPTLPDPRSFQHTYHYSLSTLPETNYRPRLADDRIGHFLTMYMDYNSVLRDSPYNRYITRWHLEKAEPKFTLSPPKQPIVFWLENTIPVEYREAVKEGILVWNAAFEKIGFKDAIVVKEQPDDADWEPADTRYSTVRWIVSPGGGYAVGPSRSNPFTGQIYDADIRISADILRYVFQEYEEFATPVAPGDTAAISRGIVRTPAQGICDYALEATKQAAFGWNVLSSRTMQAQEHINLEDYLHDFLVHLVAHEVGHTLGLRHNFKGSSILPRDQLHNTALTQENGLTGSIMDYVPVNIASEGQPQGQYFQTTLGTYDYWAIEYAYRPVDAESVQDEKSVLEEIAARSAEPQLAYGTDEDALWGARGIDPTCNRGDLGDDPITFYRDRIALVQELWSKIEEQFEKPGNRYQKLRQVFNQGIWQYYDAAFTVPKYIGGIYHNRDHVGTPHGRIPFEPVSVAKQREAFEFLKTHIFGPEAFSFSPELLNKLAPERFLDFSDSAFRMRRIDYPVHDVILSIQSLPLYFLYDPILLSRMQDLELRYSADDEPFTMAEMFMELREAIWAELSEPSNINSFRRALQRAHLEHLISMLVTPGYGIPEDACTLVRTDLVDLKTSIEHIRSDAALDASTQAHLDETLARVDAALQAQIEKRLSGF